jgi:hypothetical protein
VLLHLVVVIAAAAPAVVVKPPDGPCQDGRLCGIFGQLVASPWYGAYFLWLTRSPLFAFCQTSLALLFLVHDPTMTASLHHVPSSFSTSWIAQ